MRKWICLISLWVVLAPEQGLAEVMVLKGNYLLSNIKIVATLDGVTAFTQNNDSKIWYLDSNYIKKIALYGPAGCKEIIAEEIQSYLLENSGVKDNIEKNLVCVTREDWQLYAKTRKSPWLAVGLSYVMPFLGHAYAEEPLRGLAFLGGEVAAVILVPYVLIPALRPDEDNRGWDVLIYTGMVLGAIKFWELIDAYSVTKEYNHKLRQRLHISVGPTGSGARVVLKQEF